VLDNRLWISQLQKMLRMKDIEHIPAFKNAVAWNSALADIKKLEDDLNSGEVDFFEEQEWASSEITRLIELMGKLAVDVNIPYYTEMIQGILYDLNQEDPQKREDGKYYKVLKKTSQTCK
jgi:nicotinamide mononucleotide adenylyltransferase